MTFLSHAQNYEDVMLWRALQDVAGGFYIDVGAWDPDRDSVTRAFSERGWRGVNIEPAPEPFAALQRRRPNDVNLSVLVGAAPGQATLFDIPGTGLSTTDPALAAKHGAAGFAVTARTLPVAPLLEICRRHAPAQIHFLKIDCEGAEADVLAGADFTLFRPWIVLLEATVPGSQEANYAGWEPSLLAAGYRFAWFDGLNRFYVAEEHAARLLPKLQVPPNYFDHFVRAADIPPPPAPQPNADPLLDIPVLRPLEERIALAQRGRDCDDLPKVADAGQVLAQPDGTRVQIMHNGLKVVADGYCGPWMTDLIRRCRGHHEPQEERLFHQAALCLPADATMIELGGNWAYYSAWFLQAAPGRRAVVLEPDPANRAVGEQTMRLNGLSAGFVAGVAASVSSAAQPFATERSGTLDLPRWSVPDLMAAHGMARLDLLHCDTQGAELAVLTGCTGLLRAGRVGMVFVSTHAHQISGDPLTHQRCLRLLQECGAVVEAEHDVHESFSGDGLIVARFGPAPPGWRPVAISLARSSEVLFRDLAYDLAAAQPAVEAGRALAETVASDVFEALLFRSLDPVGLAFCADVVRRSGGAAQLLQAVLLSPEFAIKRKEFGTRYLNESPPTPTRHLPQMPTAGPFGCRTLELVLERDAPLGRAGDLLVVPNDQVILPAVLATGSWSARQVGFMADHADPARRYLALDIGANIGLYCRELLHRCANVAVVLCVEPDPQNYAALCRNLAVWPAIAQTYNIALGTADGQASFFRDHENCGNYSLHPDAMRDRPFAQSAVMVADAGPWLERHAAGEQPILWKSDTQGCDEAIVAAAPWPLWRRVQAASIELWRIRKDTPVPEGFFERVADMPNRRLGSAAASVADVRAYLSGDDWAHEDLYLWR